MMQNRIDRPAHGKWAKVYCQFAEKFVKPMKCTAGRKAEKHEYCREGQGRELMRRELDDRKSRTKVTRTGPVSQLARTGDRKHKVTEHFIPKRGPAGKFRKGAGWHTDKSNREAQHA